MKTLYSILFFADLLVLILLSFVFLRLADRGASAWALILVLSLLVGSILLMARFLVNYIKPPSGRQ